MFITKQLPARPQMMWYLLLGIHYIEHFTGADIEEINELHIFCDNCGGQNKNHALIRALMSLVETEKIKTLKLFFPQRGHS